MINYSVVPERIVQAEDKAISIFKISGQNIDDATVESFGEEWSKFDSFTDKEIKKVGDEYFDIVADEHLVDKEVLDMGCGTGRWTKYVSDKARHVHAVDPSKAVFAAAALLKDAANVTLSQAAVDNLPFENDSFDFVFSLGVLHHIPDTKSAMKSCVGKLKKGGFFLVYLYYNLDNRGKAFKALFYLSNTLRFLVSKLPGGIKRLVCDVLAIVTYMPFIWLSRLFNSIGLNSLVKHLPLSYYSDKSFNIIRNDALDRFGTPLEQRFSKNEICTMMETCGLTEIVFSKSEPYWHAIGKKI